MTSPPGAFTSGLTGKVSVMKSTVWNRLVNAHLAKVLLPGQLTKASQDAAEAFRNATGTYADLDASIDAMVAGLLAAAKRVLAPAPPCLPDPPGDPALTEFGGHGVLVRFFESTPMLGTVIDAIPPAGTAQVDLKARQYYLEKTSILHPTTTAKGFQDRRVGVLLSLRASAGRVLAEENGTLLMSEGDIQSTSSSKYTATDRKVGESAVLAKADDIVARNVASKKKLVIDGTTGTSQPQSLYHWNEVQVLSTTGDAYLGVVCSSPSVTTYAAVLGDPAAKKALAARWCARTGQASMPVYLYTYAPADPDDLTTAREVQRRLNAGERTVSRLQLIERVAP